MASSDVVTDAMLDAALRAKKVGMCMADETCPTWDAPNCAHCREHYRAVIQAALDARSKP
jgi:bacterioferritin-associated ferredoxin